MPQGAALRAKKLLGAMDDYEMIHHKSITLLMYRWSACDKVDSSLSLDHVGVEEAPPATNSCQAALGVRLRGTEAHCDAHAASEIELGTLRTR